MNLTRNVKKRKNLLESTLNKTLEVQKETKTPFIYLSLKKMHYV